MAESSRNKSNMSNKLDLKKYNEYRNKLIEEFDNKCAYCGSQLGITDFGAIDNYLPKSKFPQFANNYNNMLLACSYCNRIKADRSPIDSKGEKIIINPREDNLNDHIEENDQGILVGKTALGKNTMEFFNLNRKALIEDRIRRTLLNLMKDKSYQSIEPIINNSNSSYDHFLESIGNIRELLTLYVSDENLNKYYLKLLFANVITILETYLSDTFINMVISKDEYLRNFVETFHDFNGEKIDYNRIFVEFENIESKATKAMLDVIYHNIPKVKGMYKSTLKIEFPSDYNLKNIYKSISMRHDIIHRNGKNKQDEECEITVNTVESLIYEVEKLVKCIEDQFEVI